MATETPVESESKQAELQPKLNLVQKLAKVRQEFGYVKERGRNVKQEYNFARFGDMLGPIGDRLSQMNVAVQRRKLSVKDDWKEMESRNQGGVYKRVWSIVRVDCEFVFIDGDAPILPTGAPSDAMRKTPSGYEEFVVEACGIGWDTGDKALYKALTGAEKYAYRQTFSLATGDKDDPEWESPGHDDGEERGARGAAESAGKGGRGGKLSLKRDEKKDAGSQTVTLVSDETAAKIFELAARTGTDVAKILAQISQRPEHADGAPLTKLTEMSLDEGKWVIDRLEAKVRKLTEGAGAPAN